MAANGYTPRVKDQYQSEIRPRLKDELGLKSIMQVPRITKITLNMGVGEAKNDAKQLDQAIEELTTIAGQRAQVRRARKSVAQFKIREGMPIGAKVTRPRADHLPGDQLRRRQGGSRSRRDDHDHGRDRRPRPRAAPGHRPSVQRRGREEGPVVAKTSLVVKQKRPQKYQVRNYTRCNRCGRPRAVFKKFGLCRICLRELAHQGAIPGMTKSSW